MKKILFVHDLLSSGNDLFVQRFLSLLHNYQVIVPELPICPLEAMALLEDLCEKEHPDVIVGWLSGGFLAQQISDYNRVLVSPDYQPSVLLETLLNGEDQCRVPYLFERCDGQKNFMITTDLVQEYQQMEEHQFDEVSFSKKMVYGFFWFGKNDENLCVHAAHYADVSYLPGCDYMAVISIKAVCQTIDMVLDDRS